MRTNDLEKSSRYSKKKMQKTLAQKKMEKVVDMMFEGMDDEYLKTVMKVVYCGEDEAVLDEMAKQHLADLEAIKREMELVGDAENPVVNVVMTEEERLFDRKRNCEEKEKSPVNVNGDN